MKYLTLGVLAHVDAGKTTLCERLLFKNNSIKSFGRVDKNESFLDFEPLERKRGITIFSKQAIISGDQKDITLLDTPGHADFVWETLACMQVMDGALLIVDASSRISAHTVRLFKLLKKNNIPTFIFLNKCDLDGDFREDILAELNANGAHVVDMNSKDALEEIALCREDMLEKFLENGKLSHGEVSELFKEALFSPVFYGSALKDEGIDEINSAIFSLLSSKSFKEEQTDFYPFKIKYDKNIPYIYGKVLRPFKVKESVSGEKVEEIRLYHGEKAEQLSEVKPGMLVALRGPEKMQVKFSGYGAYTPLVEYEIILPESVDVHVFAKQMEPLTNEQPKLSLRYDPKRGAVVLSPMGDIQLEILKEIISERFGTSVDFEKSGVIYKETISAPMVGVGHFEPLRHYAEVHLLLEPNPGGGMEIAADISTDMLAINWQNQVLNVLREISVPGVLTGAALCDIKITLIAGKSHEKHTEGGDFREATLRALRQGLMSASCVLEEPVYDFSVKLPGDCLGKLMVRLENMKAKSDPPQYQGEDVIVTGSFPVSKLSDFPVFITSLTSGKGDLTLEFGGYVPCENQEEIILNSGYEAERDVDFPADSVFTNHGTSDIVYWKDARERMHVPVFSGDDDTKDDTIGAPVGGTEGELFLGLEEIESILNAAGGSNRRKTKSDRRSHWNRYSRTESYKNTGSASSESKENRGSAAKLSISTKNLPEYLLVDGYNIIFAWTDLSELADKNIDSARELLCDILDEYAAYKDINIILVFDAYKVNEGVGSVSKWGNIDVVFTKHAETADAYIERTAHDISTEHKVSVATSDRLEQIIVRGAGAKVLSARDLLGEIGQMREEIKKIIKNC